MADKYVNPVTGTDDGTAGRGDAVGDPYMSIQYALDNLGGSGTIHLATGTYAGADISGSGGYVGHDATQIGWDIIYEGDGGAVNITGASTTGVFYCASTMTSGSITLKDITTITSSAAASAGLIRVENNVTTTINNTVIGDSAVADQFVIFFNNAAHARNLSVINGSVLNGTVRAIKIESGTTCTITNSTINSTTERCIHVDTDVECNIVITGSTLNASTASGTQSAIEFSGGGATTRDLTITGSTLTAGGHVLRIISANAIVVTTSSMTAGNADQVADIAATASLSITDCPNITVTGAGIGIDTNPQTAAFTAEVTGNTFNIVTGKAVRIDTFATLCNVSNNIINIIGVGYGIIVGVDGDANANPLGMVVVNGNTIANSTGDSGHGILLGAGVNYAECRGNDISFTGTGSLNIGIVMKGEGNNVHHNTIKARRCLYLKGGQRNKIQNNTAIADGLYPLQWVISTDDPDNNIITDNVLDGSGGTYAIYIIDGTHGNNILDYNCYQVGSSGFARDEDTATTYADLTAWLAQIATWAASDLIWGDNDVNSFEADPLLEDEIDYEPGYESLLIEGGSSGQTIGAVDRSLDYPSIANTYSGDTTDGQTGMLTLPANGLKVLISESGFGVGGSSITPSFVPGYRPRYEEF